MTYPPNPTVTLRQPTPAEAELVISTDGVSVVHPLSLDQIRLLAVQLVHALAGRPVHRPISTLDLRDEVQRDHDEEYESGWSVP
jgi:hypothetical protein